MKELCLYVIYMQQGRCILDTDTSCNLLLVSPVVQRVTVSLLTAAAFFLPLKVF
jgi:hypothetical protein